MGVHGPVTVHGALVGHSNGIQQQAGNTSTSMSSTEAMSSTNPRSWAGGTKDHDMRGVSSESGRPDRGNEKMNSTWAPNHNNQNRRSLAQNARTMIGSQYVSPSGTKLALGGG